MKKILLFLILPLLLQSCLFEDKDNFDVNASARLQERIAETKATITAAPDGWILHYFPDLRFGGYNYWFSFDAGKATAAGAVGDSARFPSTYTEECLYDVIAEQGAVLTFNTYGELVHFFRNPSASAHQGRLGDYEYIVLDVKSTEIRLRGKTTGNTMRMLPLPSGYTVSEYLDVVADMEEIGKMGSYIVKHNGSDIGITVGSSGGRYLSLEYVDNAGAILKMAIPVVYTHEGFTVYHENVANDNGFFPTDGNVYYTEFVYNATTEEFTSKDGKIVFEVKPLPLNERFAAGMTMTEWNGDDTPTNGSASYLAVWSAIDAANTAAGEILHYFWLGEGINHPSSIVFVSQDPSGYWLGEYGLNFIPTAGTDDQINIVKMSDGAGVNWASYYTHLMPMVDFFASNSPWELEEIDDNTVKLTSAGNASHWVILQQ